MARPLHFSTERKAVTRRKRLLIGVLLAIPFGWVLFWAFVTVETIITLALTGRL